MPLTPSPPSPCPLPLSPQVLQREQRTLLTVMSLLNCLLLQKGIPQSCITNRALFEGFDCRRLCMLANRYLQVRGQG